MPQATKRDERLVCRHTSEMVDTRHLGSCLRVAVDSSLRSHRDRLELRPGTWPGSMRTLKDVILGGCLFRLFVHLCVGDVFRGGFWLRRLVCGWIGRCFVVDHGVRRRRPLGLGTCLVCIVVHLGLCYQGCL